MSAKKILLAFLLTSMSYASCKNTNSGNNKYKDQNNALKSAWYKRYSGTINGHAAIVNLQYSGNKLHGSWYYIDKGTIMDLAATGSVKDLSQLTLTENNTTERRPDDDTAGKDNWQLSIQNTTAKGKWISGDGKTAANIDLKEDYPEGSFPLDVLVTGNAKEDRKGVVHVSAITLYDLVQPSAQMKKDQADFLRTAILHFLGGEFANVKNINEYVYEEDKKYFDNFEKLLNDINIDREAHEDWQYNFEHARQLQALYNNNGMLVLQLHESDRTGGGQMGSHFRNRYACIDVEQKKLWQLKDIMDEDATRLSPLLNDEARRVFRIPKGTLTERLRVDSIPLTDNFYVTGTGIAFCYFPGVIAPEEDGEICLFIPYAKLKNWLKEDFKKRMPI